MAKGTFIILTAGVSTPAVNIINVLCVPTLAQASDLTAILFASAIHPISIFLFTNYCALHINSKVTIRLQNCHPRNFLL